MRTTWTCGLALAAALAAGGAQAQAQEDRAARVEHVLLVSVDGLHEVDLSRWVASHPDGALAGLARRGVTFSRAMTTLPSDSFPGLLAQVTGGTPRSTGVFYDESFDRTLFKPGSNCEGAPGTPVELTEDLSRSLADPAAGGTLGRSLTQVDTAKLPLLKTEAGCVTVLPHQYNRVNTAFEVVRAHGGRTAWADKHPAYEILQGPSGQGIDDLYTPEINAQLPGAPKGANHTSSFAGARTHDAMKLDAVLRQIGGQDSLGAGAQPVPALFGMNFQAVSVGQKLAASGPGDAPGLTGGYLDAAGTPGPALTAQLAFVDESLGRVVAALRERGLLDKTALIVSAKHGQSPIDPALRRAIPNTFAKALGDSHAYTVADDVALIWLDPARQREGYGAALAALTSQAQPLGVARILSRDELRAPYHDPFADARTPDFMVLTQPGVIYTKGSKLAEHGGGAEEDRHVALLVSAPGLQGGASDQPVTTTQVAPTLLRLLGLPPAELQAVGLEGTQALPGLFE